MEPYIKDNVSGITYMSEVINSPKQLTFTLFRKLWAH